MPAYGWNDRRQTGADQTQRRIFTLSINRTFHDLRIDKSILLRTMKFQKQHENVRHFYLHASQTQGKVNKLPRSMHSAHAEVECTTLALARWLTEIEIQPSAHIHKCCWYGTEYIKMLSFGLFDKRVRPTSNLCLSSNEMSTWICISHRNKIYKKKHATESGQSTAYNNNMFDGTNTHHRKPTATTDMTKRVSKWIVPDNQSISHAKEHRTTITGFIFSSENKCAQNGQHKCLLCSCLSFYGCKNNFRRRMTGDDNSTTAQQQNNNNKMPN